MPNPNDSKLKILLEHGSISVSGTKEFVTEVYNDLKKHILLTHTSSKNVEKGENGSSNGNKIQPVSGMLDLDGTKTNFKSKRRKNIYTDMEIGIRTPISDTKNIFVKINNTKLEGSNVVDIYLNALNEIGLDQIAKKQIKFNNEVLVSKTPTGNKKEREFKGFYVLTNASYNRTLRYIDTLRSNLNLEIEAGVN